MAATKATGVVKGFDSIPLTAEESMNQYILRKDYVVVTPDGETSEVRCELPELWTEEFSIGEKVSYRVESPSAKFGTEITSIR